ncbi:MAG: type III pantothenate kinase [Bacteriovoracaceae bacterium]|nr:type III pantothenate kinase [Bacteriovoracaceae bacterium]
MILCLDVGNSQIYGGVFDGDKLKFQFRKVSSIGQTSDEMGLFLRTVLRENGIDPSIVTDVGFCSVVPSLNHSLKNCCKRYFNVDPYCVGPGAKTGLKIKYRNPAEVGADRIATAIAAVHRYPKKNIIIVDFGTATTFCAVSKNREYLGGTILTGMKTSMEALQKKAAKLPSVEIVTPLETCGRSTVESIQAGLYYGHLGAIREITTRISNENFKDELPYIIGTGGFAGMYSECGVFDEIIPDLVLAGINQSLISNRK